jgi:hypothetical protein
VGIEISAEDADELSRPFCGEQVRHDAIETRFRETVAQLEVGGFMNSNNRGFAQAAAGQRDLRSDVIRGIVHGQTCWQDDLVEPRLHRRRPRPDHFLIAKELNLRMGRIRGNEFNPVDHGRRIDRHAILVGDRGLDVDDFDFGYSIGLALDAWRQSHVQERENQDGEDRVHDRLDPSIGW